LETIFNQDDYSPRLFNWPADEASLLKICSNLKQTARCAQRVANVCEDQTIAAILDFTLFNTVQRQLSEICDSAAGRRAFLRQTKCYHNRGVEKEVMAYKRGLEALEKMPRDSLEIKDANKFVCCFGLYVRDTIQS